ncbi:MAG: hypothetical protein JWQ87_1558 [Candidatus Sulfotelmatobacter sp.]|nr:hypothetical protein [Candidatus Sulfotelmatobacter sp.]
MRTTVVGILWLTSIACIAQVQPLQEQSTRPASQDGGVREVLESIVIPPIPNAPFSATLATEAVKYAADGTTMTFVNERHLARDKQGRIYEERWFLVPKNSGVKSAMNWIQLIDPKQHTIHNCSPTKHICDVLVYDPARDLAAASLRKGSSVALPHGDGNVVWEDLGTRNIAGINTVGVRETTITNAGTMGNDQPLTSLTEYWHSDQLGINLLSIRSSPFFGKQTFTITELTTGDPDAQMFEVPAGYKVNDQRKNPPISY